MLTLQPALDTAWCYVCRTALDLHLHCQQQGTAFCRSCALKPSGICFFSGGNLPNDTAAFGTAENWLWETILLVREICYYKTRPCIYSPSWEWGMHTGRGRVRTPGLAGILEFWPEFGATRKQPISPGNSRTCSCAGEEDSFKLKFSLSRPDVFRKFSSLCNLF